MLAAVPIKPFGIAKQRLAPILDAPSRSRLGKAIAANTLSAVAAAGVEVAVVTADPDVAAWTMRQGVPVIADPGTGLDDAAAAGVAAAVDGWAIIHADLPWLQPADLAAVLGARPPGGITLAPAADGGTSVIAGTGGFPFSYGPGSFARHLAAAVALPHAVVVRAGLALDLDTPTDLEVARSHERGDWLERAARP
jgi:2-phospho-L-lactate guanylyltransferase